MTEFGFATQPPTDGLVPDEQPPRSRAKLTAIGLVAALALVSGGYSALSLMSGGSSEPLPQVARIAPKKVVVPTVSATPKAATPKAATPKAGAVPVAYTEQLGRDPFKPLYVVPVVASPGAVAAPGAVPLASPGATYPVKLTGVTLGTGSAATSVAFVVSGVAKTVLLGQRFGAHGELVVLAVSKNATGAVTGVTVQVGDDQPAPVTIGQTISVL